MLRTTACLALLLTLPLAAQNVTIALPLLAEVPEQAVPHRAFAGSSLGFELDVPFEGKWMMIAALADDRGRIDPTTATLIWAEQYPESMLANLEAQLPDYLGGVNLAVLGMYQGVDGQVLFTAIHQIFIRLP